MEFAKYYDVTTKMNELITKGEVFSYEEGFYKKLYICMDTHDFWVCRVLEGYNSEFEEKKGKWLVERNKIDKYDFIELLEEKTNKKYKISNRFERDTLIDTLPVNRVIEYVILIDDEKGLEGWDNIECDSFEEAIEAIDGGFGIVA